MYEVAWATELVDRTGVAPTLEALIPQRRPRSLTVRGLLVAETIALREEHHLSVQDIALALHRMPPAAQDAFGVPPDLVARPPIPRIPNDMSTWGRPDAPVYYLRSALLDRLDFSPWRRPGLPEDDRRRIAQTRRAVLHARVTGWLPALPPWSVVACDATDVAAYGRPRSQRHLNLLRAAALMDEQPSR